MDKSMTSNGVDRSGNAPSSQIQKPLFPGAPRKVNPRKDVLVFLTELIGGQFKAVALHLYGGSVEQAETRLSRNLRGTEKRKLGPAEIDAILDFLGPDKEEAYMRFFCQRRGWKATERESPEDNLRREVQEARREVGLAARSMVALSDRFDELSARLEQK